MTKRFAAFAVLYLCAATGFASDPVPHRISLIYYDRSQVEPICLVPGMIANLILPCAIVEVDPSPRNDYQTKLSKVNPNRLVYWLTRGGSKPTNMIVHCSKEFFDVDLVANSRFHQDHVTILGSVGSPELSDSVVQLAASSSPFVKEGRGLGRRDHPCESVPAITSGADARSIVAKGAP